MNSASGEIADERVTQRMEAGDAGVRRVGDTGRVQVDAEHLRGLLSPPLRPLTKLRPIIPANRQRSLDQLNVALILIVVEWFRRCLFLRQVRHSKQLL